MHKVIYREKNSPVKKTLYFEHCKHFADVWCFTIGTTDCETTYISDSRIIKIFWDNSIIKRKPKKENK